MTKREGCILLLKVNLNSDLCFFFEICHLSLISLLIPIIFSAISVTLW